MSSGAAWMARRPNPRRSAWPGWAPRATPARTARPTVRSITAGSPAWNPQATFADVTRVRSSASDPMAQAPNPSPTSALRSMRGTARPSVRGDDLHLAADLAARERRGVDVAVHRPRAHARHEVGVADAGDVGGLEAALVELAVEARARGGAEVRPGAGIEGDADGAVHARGPGVDV